MIPGLVFAGSLDGHISGYEASTAKIVWDCNTAQEFKTSNGITGKGGSIDGLSPVLSGTMLFVNSGYGIFGETPGNILIAFDIEESKHRFHISPVFTCVMNINPLFYALTLSIAFSACSSSETKTDSNHQTRFVQVADSTKLEVLDWGGTGKPLLFLTGLSNTAHVFDEFAPKFTDQFHVYGLTRRGFGLSSQPTTGYDMKTLAHDILVVLDSLHIDKALLVGHSIAGDEMSKFASSYPDRVARMVYLDAAHDRTGLGLLLEKSPDFPQATARDSSSLENFTKYRKELYGIAVPAEENRHSFVFSKEGKYRRAVTPSFVYGAIIQGIEHPDYAHIQCPALAIYAEAASVKQAFPFYARLDSVDKKKAAMFAPLIQQWILKEEARFKKEMAHGTVKVIDEANHYVFISHPAETEKMIREFLK